MSAADSAPPMCDAFARAVICTQCDTDAACELVDC